MLVVCRGEDDDGRLLQVLHHLEAAHAGNAYVEEKEVRLHLPYPADGVRPVVHLADHLHDMLPGPQQLPEPVARILLVVHYEGLVLHAPFATGMVTSTVTPSW